VPQTRKESEMAKVEDASLNDYIWEAKEKELADKDAEIQRLTEENAKCRSNYTDLLAEHDAVVFQANNMAADLAKAETQRDAAYGVLRELYDSIEHSDLWEYRSWLRKKCREAGIEAALEEKHD
jgi:hypothetical protein